MLYAWSLSYTISIEHVAVIKIKVEIAYATLQISLQKHNKIFLWKKYEKWIYKNSISVDFSESTRRFHAWESFTYSCVKSTQM